MRGLALTIRQPYAWAIVSGHKKVENRTWIPPRAFVGEWLLIHAGKTIDVQAVGEVREHMRTIDMLINPDADLVTGAVVGAARYVGTATEDPGLRVPGVEVENPEEHLSSHWYSGPFGWVLEGAVKFKQPVPARGMQKLWAPGEDVLAQCREQFRRARR